MDELARRLESMREGVAPPWSEERGQRVLLGVAKVRRRQRVQRQVGAGIAVLALGFGGLMSLRAAGSSDGTGRARIASGASQTTQRAAQDQEQEQVQANPDSQAMSLAHAVRGKRLEPGQRALLPDGSQAQVSAAGGELYLDGDQPLDVELRLEAGAARFEVVPNTQRRFSVTAGSVQVLVVGTAFDVERTNDRVRVTVSHGKVRVQSAAGEEFVQAGESRWFEQANLAAGSAKRGRASKLQAAHAPRTAAADNPTQQRAQPAAEVEELPRLDWRTLNDSGDYGRAYALLVQGAPVADEAEALMDAADAARLSNHPEAAAKYLARVLANHRSSPSTPLAAFTLGRVLLERLARPSEAAEAFAAARELAPAGSLAQDALAREVEAWSKAGRSEEAYRRAHLFMKLYPQSRRAPSVKQYGGLAAP